MSERRRAEAALARNRRLGVAEEEVRIPGARGIRPGRENHHAPPRPSLSGSEQLTSVILMRCLLLLILAVVVTSCGASSMSESAGAPTQAASRFVPPEAGGAEVLEGLDGAAFMDALEAEGFDCSEPQRFTTKLQQWSCTAQATDVEGLAYEVIVLGESPAAIHSIDATVDQLTVASPDPNLSSRFLSFIAAIAGATGFTGADTAAAQEWVEQNATTESIQLELPGVTYNLRGPAELRGLEIVATE